MAFRQLCKQVSSAVVFVAAVLVGVSTPAGADGSGICGGDLNVSIEAQLVAGQSVTVPVPGTLDPGDYTIRVKTLDGYTGRELDTELTEQVSVSVSGLGAVGVSPDLNDLVDYTYEISSLGVHAIAESPSSVTVTHVGGDGPNGLVVRCVGFKRYVPPPVYDFIATAGFDCGLGAATVTVNNTADPLGVRIGVDDGSTWRNIGTGETVTTYHAAEPGEHRYWMTLFGDLVYEEIATFSCDDPPGDDPPGGDPPGDDPPGDDPPGDDPPGDDPPGDDPPGDDPPGDDPPADDPPADDPPATDDPAVVLPPGPVALSASLEVSLVCESNSLRAAVSAVGGSPTAATVALVRSDRTTPVVLTPDTTTTVSLPLPPASEGTTAEVVVVTESGSVLTREVPVDCLLPADPIIDVVIDCAARTLAVVVDNDGEESTVISAFAEQRALLGSDELAGGETLSFEIDLAGPVMPVRVVGESGTDLLREEIEHGCVESDIDASAALVCPAGEIELVLENTGTDRRSVEVGFQDTTQTVILGAQETVTLARAFDVGSAVELSVVSSLGDTLLDEVIEAWACEREQDDDRPVDPCSGPSSLVEWTVVGSTEPCDGLSVRLVVDCGVGSALATFTNESPHPVDVVLEVDSRVLATRTVDAWSTLEWPVDAAEGERISARLTGEVDAVLDARTACGRDPDRTLAVLSGLIIGLMSIVTGVVARFDPWIRV